MNEAPTASLPWREAHSHGRSRVDARGVPGSGPGADPPLRLPSLPHKTRVARRGVTHCADLGTYSGQAFLPSLRSSDGFSERRREERTKPVPTNLSGRDGLANGQPPWNKALSCAGKRPALPAPSLKGRGIDAFTGYYYLELTFNMIIN